MGLCYGFFPLYTTTNLWIKAPIWAAQYVRMSTDHRQYSTLNQSDKIQEYAQKHNIKIIKNICGWWQERAKFKWKSWATAINPRYGARQIEFKIIVYDVSRWRTFPRCWWKCLCKYVACKRAGIQIIYCARTIRKWWDSVQPLWKALNGQWLANIAVNSPIKFCGPYHLIRIRLFRQGGTAGYGLRRTDRSARKPLRNFT